MLNTIINDDCLNVLPNIESNYIDCFISDIPYKLVSGGMTGKLSNKFNSKTFNHKDPNTKNGKLFNSNIIQFKEWLPDVYRILKDGSHCYLMVNDRNLNSLLNECIKVGFELLNILVWNKGNVMPNHWYMKSCEFILFLRKGKAKYINNQSSKQIIDIPNVKNKEHPTQKPVELMELFIGNSTNINDIVLDCFMGVGTTCIAAKKLNRNYIGVEIDTNYFNIAKQQLENNLF